MKILFVIDAVLVCLIAFLFSFSYILNSGLFPLAYLFTGIFVCFLLITILTIFWEKSPDGKISVNPKEAARRERTSLIGWTLSYFCLVAYLVVDSLVRFTLLISWSSFLVTSFIGIFFSVSAGIIYFVINRGVVTPKAPIGLLGTGVLFVLLSLFLFAFGLASALKQNAILEGRLTVMGMWLVISAFFLIDGFACLATFIYGNKKHKKA